MLLQFCSHCRLTQHDFVLIRTWCWDDRNTRRDVWCIQLQQTTQNETERQTACQPQLLRPNLTQTHLTCFFWKMKHAWCSLKQLPSRCLLVACCWLLLQRPWCLTWMQQHLVTNKKIAFHFTEQHSFLPGGAEGIGNCKWTSRQHFLRSQCLIHPSFREAKTGFPMLCRSVLRVLLLDNSEQIPVGRRTIRNCTFEKATLKSGDTSIQRIMLSFSSFHSSEQAREWIEHCRHMPH